ncbi:MAG: serine hydrolase [Candidatus Omnitrophica bacterium]|nr:serine hydrolase [Candidatus Omnitrophota bacterium]
MKIVRTISITLVSVLLLSLAGALGYFAGQYKCALSVTGEKKGLLARRKTEWQALKRSLGEEIGSFNGECGVVVRDLYKGWELSHNSDAPFPSASMVKIPIMASCLVAAAQGKIKLDAAVKLNKKDKFGGSGLLKKMAPGSEFTLDELMGRMIYDSDNTATNMITTALGQGYINDSFKALGLPNTNFSRRVADYAMRDKGVENYTTAADIAGILEKMYRRELVNAKVSDKGLMIMKLQRVNDRIPKYLPVDISVAHKTGLEKGVCHDAGIIFTEKGDLLVSVLTKHPDPNASQAKEFIAKIALAAYRYIENLPGS